MRISHVQYLHNTEYSTRRVLFNPAIHFTSLLFSFLSFLFISFSVLSFFFRFYSLHLHLLHFQSDVSIHHDIPYISTYSNDGESYIPMACSKQESLKHLMNICSMIASMRESMTTCKIEES